MPREKDRSRIVYLVIFIYWTLILYFIVNNFLKYIPLTLVKVAGEQISEAPFNQNTYFHIENIALGFVGCFIGALTVSVFQLIFSYAQVFKFLKEMYPQISLIDKVEERNIRNSIVQTIDKGHSAENIARRVVYMIFAFCIALSISLGIFLLMSKWNESHYYVLKAVLLFLLIGIVPVFIGMILYLLKSPGAPLKKLLLAYKVSIDEEHRKYLAPATIPQDMEDRNGRSGVLIENIYIGIGFVFSMFIDLIKYLKKKLK